MNIIFDVKNSIFGNPKKIFKFVYQTVMIMQIIKQTISFLLDNLIVKSLQPIIKTHAASSTINWSTGLRVSWKIIMLDCSRHRFPVCIMTLSNLRGGDRVNTSLTDKICKMT